MNMYLKFQVDIAKSDRGDTQHVINSHCSRHFGTLPWFSKLCFLTDFDSVSVLGSFFRILCESRAQNVYCNAYIPILFSLTFLT